jgi:lysophospholipase L1-like esterase
MSDAESKRPPRAAFIFITIALVVVVIEVLGTIAYYGFIAASQRERLELMLGESSTWRNSAVRYRAHPFLHYTGNPYFIDPTGYRPFGDDGFRRPDSRASANPRFRVVVLGGSTTYGLLAPTTEEAWPAMLAQELRASGLDVDVRNAGLPSYNSWHLVSAASFFLKTWKPDLVILHTGFNDAFARAFADEGGPDARTLLKPFSVAELTGLEKLAFTVSRTMRVVMLPSLVSQGRLAGDLTDGMFRAPPSSTEMRTANAAARGTTFQANVETLLALIAAVGATPVLMPVPVNVESVERPPWFQIAFEGARKNADLLVEMGRARGLPVIDLRDQFRVRSDFIDDVHLTDVAETARVKTVHPLLKALLMERESAAPR